MERARVITGAFTPSSKPLAHNFRPFPHYAPFHISAFSQQASPAPPEAKRVPPGADPVRARPSSCRRPRRERKTGHPPRLGSAAPPPRPGRTFMNSSLSKHSVSGRLAGSSYFSPSRHLSAPTAGEGKKEDPVRTNLAAAARASCPGRERHFDQHGSGRTEANQRGLRRTASARRRQEGRGGNRRCHRAVGHAASVRRRAALQLRQAGLSSLAPSEVGLRMKSTGWRGLGLPLQPSFPLGKIYLQHSSRISSLILLQGLAQIQVGDRNNLGSSLFKGAPLSNSGLLSS